MLTQHNTSIITLADVVVNSDIRQGKITNDMKICFDDRQDPEYYTNQWGD